MHGILSVPAVVTRRTPRVRPHALKIQPIPHLKVWKFCKRHHHIDAVARRTEDFGADGAHVAGGEDGHRSDDGVVEDHAVERAENTVIHIQRHLWIHLLVPMLNLPPPISAGTFFQRRFFALGGLGGGVGCSAEGLLLCVELQFGEPPLGNDLYYVRVAVCGEVPAGLRQNIEPTPRRKVLINRLTQRLTHIRKPIIPRIRPGEPPPQVQNGWVEPHTPSDINHLTGRRNSIGKGLRV
mmetsp:Transcript_34286/g.66966  ORF Transcript_34286/g.66966 Transcript_34286/m.66966 type:complete len:238 (-) Transcript_34286:762-1475(-)